MLPPGLPGAVGARHPAARTAALEAARAFERLAFLNYYANAKGPGVSAVLMLSTWQSGLGRHRSWRAPMRR